jgi:hypothetical protein
LARPFIAFHGTASLLWLAQSTIPGFALSWRSKDAAASLPYGVLGVLLLKREL